LWPQKWNSEAEGSPIGQRHMRSLMVSTVAWLPSSSCSGSSSTTGAAGTWLRTLGTLGAMGRRGRSLREGLARPARPRRCTLPITALRVTPPSTRAIWLADRPSVQRFLSCSTRSSVQFNGSISGLHSGCHKISYQRERESQGLGGFHQSLSTTSPDDSDSLLFLVLQ